MPLPLEYNSHHEGVLIVLVYKTEKADQSRILNVGWCNRSLTVVQTMREVIL